MTHEKHYTYLGLSLLSCLTLAGCPDEEKLQPDADMSPSMDADMVDMFTDRLDEGRPDLEEMQDMMDMSPDVPDASCTPLTMCPEEACGEVADGCGGVLSCTPCACIDGVPSVPTCGVCDLGVARCEGDDVVCDAPHVDVNDLSNCRSAVIYVDAAFQGVSTGSKEEPFNSLNRAITEAGSTNQVRVYALRRGTYNEVPLTLPEGTHVIGGYGRDWLFSTTNQSVLRMAGSDEPASRGLMIHDNDRALTLENLKIQLLSTPDGTAYVTPLEIQSSRGVQLVRIETTSIPGVKGTSGMNGARGADGLNGGDAGSSTMLENPTPGGVAANASANCLDTNGGDGGQGASFGGAFPAMNGGAPAMGERQGGLAGTAMSLPGQDGGTGTSLSSTTLAAPSLPTGDFQWRKVQDRIELQYEGSGGAGSDGAHGGGGTGGGGGYYFTSAQPRNFAGGGGGAGGSGGCGGQGGEGGQAGGASFGLVLLDAPDTQIQASSFQAQAGGAGGAPGRGGEGGQGGLGGQGTFSQSNPGGRGGDGGRGQDGAAGAPGAGGYSVGMICNVLLQTPGEDVQAQGSVPGTGASSVDGQDKAPDGQTYDILGCVP